MTAVCHLHERFGLWSLAALRPMSPDQTALLEAGPVSLGTLVILAVLSSTLDITGVQVASTLTGQR